MKKGLVIVLALILVLSLAACGNTSTNTSTTTATASTAVAAQTTAEATATKDGATAEPVKLSLVLANAAVDGDSLDTAMDYFLSEFSKQTNGAVTGQVYPSSTLGSHVDFINSVQMGSIQVAEATAAALSTVAPKFAIFDLPYIAPGSAAKVSELLSGKAGEILTQNLVESVNLRPISWMCRTPRHVYSAKGPINTLADWKGLKIRTMESSAMVSAMKLLGATATPISTAERYMALQTGVVQAAENNVAEVFNTKEYEVTKYLSKTGHLCSPNVIFVGTKWLESLPEDYQKLVIDIGKEAGKVATDIESGKEADFEKKLVEVGKMTVNEIADTTPFQEALAPLYKEYTEKVGQDLLDLFQAAK